VPTYSSYNDWLNDLKSEQLGRLWLAKLDFDLIYGNLLPADISHFQSVIDSNLHNLSSLLSSISVIDFILKKDTASFDLQGQRAPTITEPYSCIVQLEAFSLHLVNPRVLSTVLDEGDNDMDFIWQNLGTIVTPRFHDKDLKSEREFFWCLPTAQLDALELAYSPNKGATIIRTRLGLHKADKGQRFIRIDIPSALLDGKKLCAPTSFDGGANPVFMPSQNPDGYGRTLNLKRIVRDRKELVVEKLPFTHEFKVKRVGRVGACVPPLDINAIEAAI
jgi:hypothetical protein